MHIVSEQKNVNFKMNNSKEQWAILKHNEFNENSSIHNVNTEQSSKLEKDTQSFDQRKYFEHC